ncbi:SpoIIE family protein phosphatase [Streptomyces sp. DSM 118148]|uniref:SpoIIE family protein phosphatase n=1 Tax=Streptomyces sp. DSM 118148 TaxID=3448667 RepID=UPI00403FD4D6
MACRLVRGGVRRRDRAGGAGLHRPPLLTTQGGGTRYLNTGRGLLTGLDPDLPRTSACVPLPPHSTPLLFTGGLIERRRESLGPSAFSAPDVRRRATTRRNDRAADSSLRPTDDPRLRRVQYSPQRFRVRSFPADRADQER